LDIDLRDYVYSNKIPSNNELGLRIARGLGFTEGEIAAYATAAGKRNSGEFGEAFYNGSKEPSANQYWLDQARKDPNGGLVSIPEERAGEIKRLLAWRNEYREEHGPHIKMERATLTAEEEIIKHILNPVANAGNTGLQTVG